MQGFFFECLFLTFFTFFSEILANFHKKNANLSKKFANFRKKTQKNAKKRKRLPHRRLIAFLQLFKGFVAHFWHTFRATAYCRGTLCGTLQMPTQQGTANYSFSSGILFQFFPHFLFLS